MLGLAVPVAGAQNHADGGARPSGAVRELASAFSLSAGQLRDPALHVLAEDRVMALRDLPRDASAGNVTLIQRTGSAVERISTVSGRDLDQPEPQAAYALPVRFRGLARATPQALPEAIEFEPVVLILSALRFKETLRRFDGELAVGLRNRHRHDDRSVLERPVKLLIRADADEIAPAEIEIKQLGEPVPVVIGVRNPVPPFRVSARTLLDDGDVIDMPVSRPSLTIEPARSGIDGFGLGKTLLQVQAMGLDHPEHFSVALRTTLGEISPTPITLAADGRASAELRSESAGTATIHVSGDPMQDAQVTVEFVTPWRTLLAALLGAVTGWFLRTRGRSRSARSAMLAVATSAVLLVAYMLGIHWLQWAPSAQAGEALAFFVSAMGAYLGLQALLKSATQPAETGSG